MYLLDPIQEAGIAESECYAESLLEGCGCQEENCLDCNPQLRAQHNAHQAARLEASIAEELADGQPW